MARKALVPTVVVLAACQAPPVASVGSPPLPAPPASSAAPAPDPLPPGVLAQAVGINGLVRVEDRGNLRVLTIDDVVQGAVPIDVPSSLVTEPIAGLVRAFRPEAKTGLVIGLGTGRTATALTTAGLALEVVEVEPSVASFAKRFFGYRGDVVIDDGLNHVRQSTRTYDLILLDADLGNSFPPALITDDALKTYQEHLTPTGVLVVRTIASPSDAMPTALFRRLPHHLKLMFGTGVGAERQNLYLLSSEAPMFAPDLSSVAAWPVLIPGSTQEQLPRSMPKDNATREVTVLGYVIRAEDGSLCLDLPHWEMGAVRYVLKGPEAEALGQRLPRSLKFPTAGDIRSDGDTSNTLQSLLGGGGVKRSDVRFSPLVAIVRGTARARVITHPDDAWGPSATGPRQFHPLLPYGGVLYELEVDGVLWTFEQAAWLRARRAASSAAQKVVSALRAGDLQLAGDGLELYRGVLVRELGKPALELHIVQEVEVLYAAVRTELAAAPTTDFDVGAACDRLANVRVGESVNADLLKFRSSLQGCAVDRYKRVVRAAEPAASIAAARLKSLLAWEPEAFPGASRLLRELQTRYPDVEPRAEPPSGR